MKLISLNLEGKRNLDVALPFLVAEKADVLTLTEAPEDLQAWLHAHQYSTSYLPMILRTQDGNQFSEGIILASRQSHQVNMSYYYQPPHGAIVDFVETDKRGSVSQGILIAEIGEYVIATTHFTWTPHGEEPNEDQRTDLSTLRSLLATLPPHVLCGDFNIPRHESPLYPELSRGYTDAIPTEYTSSLDAGRHRCGGDATLAKLFKRFMVDYCFTQAPYHATDVRLQFGVSDHAAVVATITKVMN